ncbi:glycosyl hydrolase 5 family protein-like [Prosopis cineraria]|uniref:glycosyl hydrolase 5 family protein-like n=1 Tax=Prosopis cineraria TaxID=364024 RepID=UPI00240E9CE8|nr:glycosyl hydrolase 5 family protein-like [Prosopis cineraria]
MLRLTSKSLFIIFLLLASSCLLSSSYPLSTQNKWILDESTGRRAKFACVNWAGHLEPMIPEGFHKQPLKHIVAQIAQHKFNCVRLTYAIHMWTRHGNDTVGDTLLHLDLPDAIQGMEKNNPSFLEMTHVQVFEVVVRELGAHKVRVLLDNHVSKPKWCCNDDDENGFFHDRHFDPEEWTQGLTLAAKHFAGNSAVAAMSLRNELHGPRQNQGDWYKYMSHAARAIHKANPQVLVVISGLNYDTELQFLRKKALNLDIGKKLVFETHLYSWSGIGTLKLDGIWTKQPLNRICAQSAKGIDYRAGFVTTGENAVPLIFTEFGFDQTGGSEEDLKFLTCIQTYLAGRDMDWGLWTLQGSYYMREERVDVEDTFGVLDSSWNQLKNPNLTQVLQLLQRTNQDPGSKLPQHSILYHPLSGQCVTVNEKDEVELGSCENKSRWHHAKKGNQILLVGTDKCLSANGEGLPVLVSAGHNCNSHKSAWKSLSLSKLHLGIKQENDHHLCLQKDSNTSAIVTAKCICIRNEDSLCLDDPRSQWFQFVPANV